MRRFIEWAATYHVARWMLIASMLIWMALLHPRLITYILAGINCAWMFATIEIAHVEARYRTRICYLCILGPIAIIALAFFLIVKINWLAM